LEPPSGVGEKETAAEQPAKNGPPATPIKKGPQSLFYAKMLTPIARFQAKASM
jgi:hypothetical protein